jgi:hypothetical protein
MTLNTDSRQTPSARRYRSEDPEKTRATNVETGRDRKKTDMILNTDRRPTQPGDTGREPSNR